MTSPSQIDRLDLDGSLQEGEATVRVLVGDGSPAELGTPALILDVVLEAGRRRSIGCVCSSRGERMG